MAYFDPSINSGESSSIHRDVRLSKFQLSSIENSLDVDIISNSKPKAFYNAESYFPTQNTKHLKSTRDQ